MKMPARRKIIWGLAIAGLVLIGMGAYGYFIGTRTMLEHAESLSLRRLKVANIEGQDANRFFYISNRELQEPGGDLGHRFHSRRDGELKFGHFDVRVEPSLGIGMLVDPSAWLINEEIQLLQVRAQEKADFTDQLRQQVENSRDRSLLVVVHGFASPTPLHSVKPRSSPTCWT